MADQLEEQPGEEVELGEQPGEESGPEASSPNPVPEEPIRQGGFIAPAIPETLDPASRQTSATDNPLTPTSPDSQLFRSGPTPRPPQVDTIQQPSQPSRPPATPPATSPATPSATPSGGTASPTGTAPPTGTASPTGTAPPLIPPAPSAAAPHPQAQSQPQQPEPAPNPANQPKPSLVERLKKGTSSLRNRRGTGSEQTTPRPLKSNGPAQGFPQASPTQPKSGQTGKVGEVTQDVKTALNVGRAAAGDVTAMAKLASNPREIWRFMKSGAKRQRQMYLAVGGLCILIFGFIALVIGLVIIPKQPGNRPLTAYSIGSAYGEWCENMQPSLTLENGHTLMLPTTDGKGKIGVEDPVNEIATSSGEDKYQYWDGREWRSLAIGAKRIDDRIKEGKLEAKDLRFYVVSRWPSQEAAYNFSGRPVPPRKTDGLPSLTEYWGIKVIVYNPKNKEGVIGVIAESGPAPWAGTAFSKTDKPDFWPDRTVFNPPGYGGRSFGAPRKEWLTQPPGNEYPDKTPLGREKGSLGMIEMLALDTNDEVIVGFVPLEQQVSTKPGTTFTCQPKRAINDAEFRTAYTEGTLATCTQLANNPLVTTRNDRAKQSLLTGRYGGISLDLRVCGILDLLVKNNIPLDISSLIRPKAKNSRHRTGKAVDIANVSIGPGIFKLIYENKALLTKNGLMPENVIGPEGMVRSEYAPWGIADGKHEDHIHVEFPP